MNKQKAIANFLNKISDGNSKLSEKLKDKLNKGKSQKEGGSKGLEDKLNLNPKGKLKVERLDADGNVIETVEKDNLVVNQAFDMLLKGMAGDSESVLYYVPKLKPESSDYEWVISDEKKALVSDSEGSLSTSSMGNIYGSSISASEIIALPKPLIDTSVNFVGLGVSPLRYLDNDEDELTYTSNWTLEEDSNYKYGSAHKTSTTTETITYNSDTELLTMYVTVHPEGSKFEISVDGTVVDTVDTYSATTTYTQEYEIDLSSAPNAGDERTIVVEHIGTSNSEVTTPTVIFEGLQYEGYTQNTTGLAHEVNIKTDEVDVPEYYNTTNKAPYTFFLDLKSQGNAVLTDTVKVVVDGTEYTQVDTAPTPDAEEFHVEPTGEVILGTEDRNVAVTYKLDNEFETNYKRALIEKPEDTDKDYPIYSFHRDKITFEAEFDKRVPKQPVTINEFALFNTPLKSRFSSDTGSLENELMFSITDAPSLRKNPNNGLRVIWEIEFDRA
jgi:hypothetical protein